MSGFWAAADRVRSGAPADAAPRPLSRFEPEAGEPAMLDEEIVPLALDVPRDAPVRGAVASSPVADVPVPAVPTVASIDSGAPRVPLQPIDRHEAVPPAPPAVAPATPVEPLPEPVAAAPTVAEPPLREVIERTVDATVPAPTAAASSPGIAEPVIADPSPVSIDVPLATDAPSSIAAPVLAAPRDPAPSRAPEPETVANNAPLHLDTDVPEPLHIHIDRIEIRIDSPAPPARAPAAAPRQRAAPVDLNDYLHTGGPVSEALAIPATTLVLKLMIEKRLGTAYGTLTAPGVSIAPPPQRTPAPASGGPAPPAEAALLYLYLHHVTPNPAWRNMYDPHVSGAGERVGPAPVVLDLSYMVTAQGADLEREALLGVAVSALTRNAVVPRPMITKLLKTVSVNDPAHNLFDLIPKAPLDDPKHQLESLTIAQSPIDIDMSTKLWSALQSPLRPSAYFTVTTVFLDVDETFPAGIDVTKLRVGAWPDPDARVDLPADNEAVIP